MSSSASYSQIVPKIYKSRNIILKILNSRGYNTEDYENFSIGDVLTMFNAVPKQLDMLLENEEGKKIYVKYHLTTARVKSSHIRETMEDLYDLEEILSDKDELIIIGKDKINDKIKNLLLEIYKNEHKFVNVYNLNNYLFNILEHVLVPPHRVLSESEKQKTYTDYNISKDDELPEISRFDPVAQALGMKPGDVCEIIRPSPTSIESLYYRFCSH
jgi:DNA-directed RNA polymerase subunit H (RpoH/RPB5)|tara:strand:- start:4185 stop:4829 length:645 start_codon:yes stop_codon:yes gene_type:complete